MKRTKKGRREDIFTAAYRTESLKVFNAVAKRLFLADISDSEIRELADELREHITSAVSGRGWGRS